MPVTERQVGRGTAPAGPNCNALRLTDSTEPLDFDDPAKDPYRVKGALDYLHKKIGLAKHGEVMFCFSRCEIQKSIDPQRRGGRS